MANPQLEDGHTRIANELMEQLMKLYLAPNQWQVLVCIIRKTYGFHKKIDYITNTQICAGTGLVKSTVSRAVTVLKQRNIITRDGKHIGLQKDWEQWQKLAEQATKVSGTANYIGAEKLAIPQPKLAIPQPKLAVRASKVSSSLDTQKEDTIQKKLYKRKKYGEFQNVLLTDKEVEELKERLGAELDRYIENLSDYLEQHKKKHYDSHYATILNWYRREKEDKVGKNKSRGLPDRGSYTPSPNVDD